MRNRLPRLVGLIAAAGVFAAAAGSGAETVNLELKRLEPFDPMQMAQSGPPADYVFRTVTSQSFFMQVTSQRTYGGSADFSQVVTKEPAKYEAEHPLRGVAKLGAQQYGFVLDGTPAEPDSKEGKSTGYARLYFDLNHNGDLTDDEVIEAIRPKAGREVRLPAGYFRHEFPRVDISLDVEGTKVDYAFSLRVQSQTSKEFSYASASLSAAAYREGRITLDGKPRRIVLLDYNSNGRFDDEFKIRGDVRTSDGQVYASQGDMLIVDPRTSGAGYRYSYSVTANDEWHYLSKLVNVDGRLYDVEVSTAGDKLTLTPSSVPPGKVTNANEGFRAVVYGEQGFLKISGGKSRPATLPEGDWRLLSYTIDQTAYPGTADQPAEKQQKKESSLLQVLAQALAGGATSVSPGRAAPRYTVVSAQATKDYPAVTVRKGETVAMPFGPPYKPVVKVDYVPGPEQVQLGLSLVGSAGEVCTDMMVDGRRPEKPEFTISTPDGKEVERGEFEYG